MGRMCIACFRERHKAGRARRKGGRYIFSRCSTAGPVSGYLPGITVERWTATSPAAVVPEQSSIKDGQIQYLKSPPPTKQPLERSTRARQNTTE